MFVLLSNAYCDAVLVLVGLCSVSRKRGCLSVFL